jgi:hypothetical protein
VLSAAVAGVLGYFVLLVAVGAEVSSLSRRVEDLQETADSLRLVCATERAELGRSLRLESLMATLETAGFRSPRPQQTVFVVPTEAEPSALQAWSLLRAGWLPWGVKEARASEAGETWRAVAARGYGRR